MKLTDREVFLLLHREPTGDGFAVRIVGSREAALKEWTPSTRMSSLFCVEWSRISSPPGYQFRGQHRILFLGPVHPEPALAHCGEGTHAWLSLGLFNLIIVFPHSTDHRSLLAWAKNEHIPYELWMLTQGIVQKRVSSLPPKQSTGWRDHIAKVASATYPIELREAIHEYCPLMASALSRSVTLPDHISRELVVMSDQFSRMLDQFTKPGSLELHYQALDQMLTINAGLSRLASQTFAGTAPIVERECHFWSQSFLGIGIATIGLWNLRRFVDRTLGAARIPERFAALKNRTKGIPDLTQTPPPDEDFLASVQDSDVGLEPLLPLLPYFSARDGYRSTATTVSAPLAAVCSCNSPRWSLTTLTHEFSHVVVRAVLSDLYPDLNDSTELDNLRGLYDSNRSGPTLFEEIRRILLFSILKMDEAVSGRPVDLSQDSGNERLRRCFERWRHEVDETMVHVFDMLYFYGQDVDRYVLGIWASWGTIPNVSTRVRDYVVRTISAVLAKHLRRGSAGEDTAKEQVRDALEQLDSRGLGGRYVREAIDYIDRRWKDEIRLRVKARRQLVKIVHGFLFSNAVATSIRSEPEISGGATETEGYALHRGDLELRKIRNPLRFVEVYTQSAQPSASFSLWMFYILAFCLYDDV